MVYGGATTTAVLTVAVVHSTPRFSLGSQTLWCSRECPCSGSPILIDSLPTNSVTKRGGMGPCTPIPMYHNTGTCAMDPWLMRSHPTSVPGVQGNRTSYRTSTKSRSLQGFERLALCNAGTTKASYDPHLHPRILPLIFIFSLITFWGRTPTFFARSLWSFSQHYRPTSPTDLP